MNVCKLFLNGKCYNPYCTKEHLVKYLDTDLYIISDTNFTYTGDPYKMDQKLKRLEDEKNMTELEKLSNKITFEANCRFKEVQIKKKKDFYKDKNILLGVLTNEEILLLEQIYPTFIDNNKIAEKKCGLASSFHAAISNSIDWDAERKLYIN